MASGLTVYQSGTLRPAQGETVFCKTLVVGNTLAAYTATLAILQAGEQVCWAQSELTGLTALIRQQLSGDSRFSWRLGRRVSLWETATVMSQSQQTFWDNWQTQRTSTIAIPPQKQPAMASATKPQQTPRPSRETQFRQAIAPYLENQQLMLVPQCVPIRVLYSQQRGHRRVHQIVFRHLKTRRRFQIHARLILDATFDAQLRKDLADKPGQLPTPELKLTLEQIAPNLRQNARGEFFADTIALVMADGFENRSKPLPLCVPLRSLLLENTEGLICVSLPNCDQTLLPTFQQSRAQWTLGEAAGLVAARAAQAGGIANLRKGCHWQWHLQRALVQQGLPMFAFDDVSLEDPDFEAIQMVAIADVVRTMRRRDLGFRPETPITRAVLASALARLPAMPDGPPDQIHLHPVADVTPYHWAASAIQVALTEDLLGTTPQTTFRPSKVLSKRELWQVVRPLYKDSSAPPFVADDAPARRRHLSRSLYPILVSRLNS